MSGVHEAIGGAKVKSDVRKAYGVSSRGAPTELKAVAAGGEKIVGRAPGEPGRRRSGSGCCRGDVTALSAALAALAAAEAAAKVTGSGSGGVTAKERKAAEVGMHEATARIAGVGALAFCAECGGEGRSSRG